MAKNTISLKTVNEIINEKIAAGTITPGMLIEVTSADTYQAHGTATGPGRAIFALEDAPQSGGEISENYAATDRVRGQTFRSGDQVYALLSASETVAIGGALESNGDGTLQAYTSGSVIGYAVDAPAATSANQRIIVEIA